MLNYHNDKDGVTSAKAFKYTAVYDTCKIPVPIVFMYVHIPAVSLLTCQDAPLSHFLALTFQKSSKYIIFVPKIGSFWVLYCILCQYVPRASSDMKLRNI